MTKINRIIDRLNDLTNTVERMIEEEEARWADDDTVTVPRVLLDDLDEALLAYAPNSTKELRERLLNAIADGR